MENSNKKSVHFDMNIKRLEMRVWLYAYHHARVSEWQRVAVDRLRFQNRINQINRKISLVLSEEHRLKMFQKLYANNLQY